MKIRLDGNDVLVGVGWWLVTVGCWLLWGLGAGLLVGGGVMMMVGLAGALRKAG